MRDRDYNNTIEFLSAFFGDVEGVIELRACPNLQGAWTAKSLRSTVADQWQSFCEEHDRDGGAVYFGVCSRRPDATSGGKESVLWCPAIWVDIDCAKMGISGEEAIKALNFLPFPPSYIVISGAGLHAYWVLEEPVDVSTQELYMPIEALCRQLALILAGDMACAQIAQIMRLPGTFNSKDATKALNDGAPIECELHSSTGRVYDIEQITEWLAEQRPLLKRNTPSAVRPVQEDNAFLSYARQAGYEPAIDIEAELAAMEYGGTGDNSVHRTQIRVAYSMIARGYEDDDIVATLLAATEAAAPRDAHWNWALEERTIRKDIARARPKQAAAPRRTTPSFNGNAALKLVHDAEPAPATPPKAKSETSSKNEITVLGGATLAAWTERYGPIMHSQGGSYMYEAGVWVGWDQCHDQMLRALLQEGCARLNMKPATSLLNSATRYVMDNPDILVRSVEFDAPGLIVADDGVLFLDSMEIGPHSPDHRAKFRIGARLNGDRRCPTMIAFLNESFSDHPLDIRDAIVRTLQEWFGACLIANKPRSLRKGLLVHGGSRTGKTQVSEILRELLGRGSTTAIKVRDLEKDFGTETLIGKRGWVADDAVGQGETLDAETYKVLVTGEAMSIRRKNRSMIDGFRFGYPVCLTMNNLPKIKDGSDAVYNRSLILPMTNVRAENAPEPAGYDSIAEKIIAEELTGVLWWAIEGWQRLAARGVYDPPACMTEAVRALQEANDDIGTWASQCAEYSPSHMVAPADLFASFAGWFFQEKGDTRFGWSQNGFSRILKERMPKVAPHRDGKARWIKGIRLNDDGLEYWTVNSDRDAMRRTTAKSIDAYSVNQVSATHEPGPAGRTRF